MGSSWQEGRYLSSQKNTVTPLAASSDRAKAETLARSFLSKRRICPRSAPKRYRFLARLQADCFSRQGGKALI
jgi:hypothetical protein